jgi:photosystem II PsbM protein
MKTFQIVTLFALLASAMAFAPNQVPQGESDVSTKEEIRCYQDLCSNEGRRTIAESSLTCVILQGLISGVFDVTRTLFGNILPFEGRIFVAFVPIPLENIFLTLIFFVLLSPVAKTVGKVAAGSLPVAAITAPAFALDSIVEAMPTTNVALEVTFGAYLAVALGTLLPCLFLINLYIQTESRKAGREGGQDSQ